MSVLRAPFWQKSLVALLLWLPLEDQVRKMTGNPLWVFLLKDGVVLVTVVACAAANPRLLSRTSFPRGLAVVLAWGFVLHVLGSFNPLLPGATVALVGIKMTFSYVPLFLVGCALAADERALRAVLLAAVATGAAVSAIGLYQGFVDPSFLTPERSANLAGLQLWETRGAVAYITSLFISPGRYVLYLLNAYGAALTLSLLERARGRRLAVLAATIVIALGLFASGGRTGPVSALAVLVLAIMVGLWQRGADQRGRRGTTRALIVTAAVGAAVLALVAVKVPQLAEILGFYQQSLSEDGPIERLEGAIGQASQVVDGRTWLMGRGTGSMSFGVSYVQPDVELAVEGGYLTHLWELGALGLAFYVALAAAVCRLFLRRPPPPGDRAVEAVACGIGALVAWELWAVNLLAPVLQQYVVGLPLWLFAGVAWGLRARPAAAASARAAPPAPAR